MKLIDINRHYYLNKIDTDICIIGSGPAGAVLAKELSSLSKLNISIFEAGNFKAQPIFENFENNCLFNENFIKASSISIGGLSNQWSGRSSPLEEIDFKNWPIDYDEIKPFYNEARKILNLPNEISYRYDFDKSHIKKFELYKKLRSKVFYFAKKPFEAYELISNIDNINLYYNAKIISIIENRYNNNIIGAKLYNNGKIIEINAKFFILCCGGLEVPRLLLNSRNQSNFGIGNNYDNVGKYLSTHPKSNVLQVTLKRPINFNNPFFKRKTHQNGFISLGIGFGKSSIDSELGLNHYFQLRPIFESKFNIINKIIKPFSNKQFIQSFILRGFFDQFPNSENRLILSNNITENGTNKAIIKWKLSSNDLISIKTSINLMKDIFLTSKVVEFENFNFDKLKDSQTNIIKIHSHFMGTTRMGSDQKISVTDKNCKVHGYNNLFISGPSNFPSYGYSNPMMTIVALSSRLGKYIKSIG